MDDRLHNATDRVVAAAELLASLVLHPADRDGWSLTDVAGDVLDRVSEWFEVDAGAPGDEPQQG